MTRLPLYGGAILLKLYARIGAVSIRLRDINAHCTLCQAVSPTNQGGLPERLTRESICPVVIGCNRGVLIVVNKGNLPLHRRTVYVGDIPGPCFFPSRWLWVVILYARTGAVSSLFA